MFCLLFLFYNIMKEKSFTLLFVLLCQLSIAQVGSITTSKTDEVSRKLKTFIVVDQGTGYALGKENKIYEKDSENPMCYFTSVPLSETGLTTVNGLRIMGIFDAKSTPDERWNVQYNAQEDAVVFGRSRFVPRKFDALWSPLLDGDHVVFRTLEGGNNANWIKFLAMGEDGKLKRVDSFEEASRWTLIYHQ